jgi:hypothetical protein
LWPLNVLMQQPLLGALLECLPFGAPKSSRNIFSIRKHGNRCDTIFNIKNYNILTSFNIPELNCAIVIVRNDMRLSRAKFKGCIYCSWPASKGISEGPGNNPPDSDQLILGTSSKVSSIWIEANTLKVNISDCIHSLNFGDINLLSSDNIKDPCGSVTARSNIFSAMAKSDAGGGGTLVLKSVKKANIKQMENFWVEDSKPFRLDMILVYWQTRGNFKNRLLRIHQSTTMEHQTPDMNQNLRDIHTIIPTTESKISTVSYLKPLR